jgi:hypothetical protein
MYTNAFTIHSALSGVLDVEQLSLMLDLDYVTNLDTLWHDL